jgi:hypothetical protein
LKSKRLLVLPLVAVLFHWPRIAFFVESAQRFKMRAPWADDFKLMCAWDCNWFLDQSTKLSPEGSAFYPLYPLLLRVFRALVPVISPQAATIVLSNLLSIACCCLAVLLGERLWPGDKRRYWGYGLGSWALGFVIAAFPFSQFASFGYSEPLFVCLFSSCLILVCAGRWELAAIAAGLCAVTRPPGVWVMGTFVLVYLWSLGLLSRRPKVGAISWKAAFVLLASGLPLAAYMAFNWSMTGDPLHFIRVEGKWDRHFNLAAGLLAHLPRYELNHFFLYGSLYAGWLFFKRKAPAWKILGVTAVLAAEVPLFVGGYGYSYSRQMAGSLGLFALVVEVFTRNPWLWTGWTAWSLFRLSVEANNWFGDGYKLGP